jgi:hypothetical protein
MTNTKQKARELNYKKIVFLIIINLIVITLFMTNVSAIVFQHGTSRDLVMGYDKGWIWYHAYLKNDHTTAYCFDNPDFIKILDDSQKNQKEVIVTYETYLFRGFFCTVAYHYEKVIIINVEYAI